MKEGFRKTGSTLAGSLNSSQSCQTPSFYHNPPKEALNRTVTNLLSPFSINLYY